ncbi:dimethyl sulfoxide reductase anchor subunit family protein [Rubneribacter sp.]
MHPEWPLILFTFFLCVAGGTLAVQGLLCVLGKGKKMQIASLAVSLATLAVGGIAVFMHLQHWERIFNGFGHITSGITLEFIGCIVFAVVLVLYFLMMRRSEDGMAPKWCGVLAIVVGLGLPAVTGDSYLMEALPSWDTPLLIAYYVVNAVFMGGLTATVVAGVTGADDAQELALKASLAGGVLQLAVVLVYALVINGSAGLYSAEIQYYFDPTLPDVAMVDRAGIVGSILAGSQAVAFWLGAIAVGIAAPVALTWLALRQKAAGTKLAGYAGAALACCTVGGICWRVILYVVAISVFALY